MISTLQTHVPARLPPPPRQVRRRSAAAVVNYGCMMVFMIPFVVAGIGFTMAIPIRRYVQSHGTPIAAIIESKSISSSSNHSSHTYHVMFHYAFHGQVLHDSQQVSSAEYSAARVRQSVPGRAMMLLRWPICVTEIGSIAGTMNNFILVWDGFLVLWLTFMFGPLMREKKLVAQGTAVMGTITDRQMMRSKSTSYFLSYDFKASDGRDMSGRKLINQALYDSTQVGNAVTVLYDPSRPKRSVPYEFSNYEVVV